MVLFLSDSAGVLNNSLGYFFSFLLPRVGGGAVAFLFSGQLLQRLGDLEFRIFGKEREYKAYSGNRTEK